MRRPRRLSRPTTSERRRPRSEPSDRPESFKGIWTRRPSLRIAIATWRRLRPPNRPNVGLPNEPGRPGRSAQSTRRSVIMQPPGPHRTRVAPLRAGSNPRPSARPAPGPRCRKPRNRRSLGGLVGGCAGDAARFAGSGCRPTVAGLQDDRGAGERGEDQNDAEGLGLHLPCHAVSSSGRRRRGSGPGTRGASGPQ
jgi:hypothetical protein